MNEPSNIATKDRTSPTGPERTRGGAYFTPHVDIYEDREGIHVLADLPGVSRARLDMDIN